MGDTGSMAFGGALAGFAIVTGTEALLLLIAGIYVVEALSVIIQTVSFKYWGRRVFLIAPIHHHFEMKAWSETKIMVRFWIVAAILAACGFVLYYRYYLQFRLCEARCLVLGLARSGRAARAALEARGVEVVAADRTLGNDGDLDAARRRRRARQEPGRAGRGAARRRGARARDSRLERDRARVAVPREPDRRRHRDERQDDDDRAARARSSARARPGNVGTALTELVDEVAPEAWIVCELSSFQLEDVDALPADDRRPPQPRARPPRPARHASSLPRREAAHLREPAAGDVAVVPRGFGADPRRGRRVEFSADDELPAEPLIPGAHNRENAAAATAAARALGVDDDAIAAALRRRSPACRTGSSSSPSATASAASTTRRRRTPRLRGAP